MNAETRIKIICEQLARMDRTDDEYLQGYFAGVEKALELITKPGRESDAGRYTT